MIVEHRLVRLECHRLAKLFYCFAMAARLMQEHAQQVTRISVLRSVLQDAAIALFRFGKITRLMGLKRGCEGLVESIHWGLSSFLIKPVLIDLPIQSCPADAQ